MRHRARRIGWRAHVGPRRAAAPGVHRHRPLAGRPGLAPGGRFEPTPERTAGRVPDVLGPGYEEESPGDVVFGSPGRGASAPGASRAAMPASCGSSSATRRTARDVRRRSVPVHRGRRRRTVGVTWTSTSPTTRRASSARTPPARCPGRRTGWRCASRRGSGPSTVPDPIVPVRWSPWSCRAGA
jgi:hypothetical protein